MKLLSKPVWREGMHLTQHHFQTQGRYFEDSIAFAMGLLFFKAYGVSGLELDSESLRNGTVSLVHARGTMRDGLTFNIPEGDPRPEPRAIRDLFSPTDQAHVVHLAIPGYRLGEKNCSLPTDRDRDGLRYRASQDRILDDTSGSDEQEILVGTKNFRLLLDQELEPEHVSLPLARVVREGTGQFAYDPYFIAPSLQIGASSRIMEILGRLVEILETKLTQRSEADATRGTQYSFADVEDYWKSHAIRSSLAPLRNYLHSTRTPPETLYVELSRLAGALSTFDLESDVTQIPLYNHDEPETCFNTIDKQLRGELAQDDARELCIRLNIRAAPPPYQAIRGCTIKDQRCLERGAEWYVGVRSPAPLADVAKIVSRSLKVGSANTIVELVNEARPGARLEYIQAPPAVISPKLGTAYFRLARTGRSWDAIVREKSIAIYLPKKLPEADVEVLVVLAS